MTKRAKAFTLVELLVVVSIISLLVTILAPTLGRVRELTKRAVCATNLNAAGKGLNVYAAEYGGKFPTRGYGPDTSRFDVMGDSATSDPDSANSNSRNLFLAVRLSFVEPDQLICPATSNKAAVIEQGGDTYYDFGSYSNCSYSYHLQFSRRGTSKGYPLTLSASNSGMALLADKNPFVKYTGANTDASVGIPASADPSTKDGNSRNHGTDDDNDGQGQNVAFLDGHAKWFVKPTAGVAGDNIYTVWDGDDRKDGTIAQSSMPQGKTDSFLVP